MIFLYPDSQYYFMSILQVVKWGRSVYANTQKFIQFQFTVIVASLLINIAGAATSGNVPLNAVQVCNLSFHSCKNFTYYFQALISIHRSLYFQLLWINFVMDTLGVLALATEPPADQLMHRPPIDRR